MATIDERVAALRGELFADETEGERWSTATAVALVAVPDGFSLWVYSNDFWDVPTWYASGCTTADEAVSKAEAATREAVAASAAWEAEMAEEGNDE